MYAPRRRSSPGPLLLLVVACVVSCDRGSGQAPDIGVQADIAAPPNDAETLDAGKTLPWVSTFAGTICNVGQIDGPRLKASFAAIHHIALGSGGQLYVLDGGSVRTVNNTRVSTIVSEGGTKHKDGPVATVGFSFTGGLGLAKDGRVFLSEHYVVRMINKGQVTTVAGKWDEQGHVDGQGATARFSEIRGLAVDASGAVIISESFYLRRLYQGRVTTLTGVGSVGQSHPKDGAAEHAVMAAARAVTAVGDRIYFADHGTIRVLDRGTVTTIAGVSGVPYEFKDGPATSARFSEIFSITHFGVALYLADYADNHRIRKLENGVVSSVTSGKAGLKDGPLVQALFNRPISIAADPRGNLFVADFENCRIRYIQFK